jgi:hypothetical protein
LCTLCSLRSHKKGNVVHFSAKPKNEPPIPFV